MNILRNPLVGIWFLLIVITFATWWWGSNPVGSNLDVSDLSVAFLLTIFIVLVSVVKVRIIIWCFMEVNKAPRWLRWTFDAWLAVIALGLPMLYSYSLHG